MSKTQFETRDGGCVTVRDDFGNPITIGLESHEADSVYIYLSEKEARKLARVLDAFAAIHDPKE